MADFSHTPGPWSVVSHDEGEWGESYMILQDGNLMLPVAEMITQEADARLIAAAPDMAEALERALTYIERDEEAHGRQFGEGNVIRAALARAKGATT